VFIFILFFYFLLLMMAAISLKEIIKLCYSDRQFYFPVGQHQLNGNKQSYDMFWSFVDAKPFSIPLLWATYRQPLVVKETTLKVAGYI